ncbi:Large subunit GTPase 1 [Wickerhamomyces ciferrii]|uniref:Large subunit GTPase 1 n=1 Tax=Wickerhamomyces ciferrii (strain ATCC 14091 / BCRC 22168 / CBS 111 / JCM 3599 / NBRC 0793 / NRRL Y-1031 F-60-10) TaxID=1206466 RepID=K0KNA1_WICCF|nr:Large subunit GTPase 1 [Wickerhamomyces ciferrii]CCH42603.1 Large subunit GTPase 1 [Wickerhamomyces ciferrii]
MGFHEAPKKFKVPKGPKPIPHKNKNTIGLGRSIANVRAKENRVEYLPDGEMRFTTDKHEDSWVKLRSVTQENALDEFLNTAELADTDFTADKNNQVTIIKVDPSKNPYLLTNDEEKKKSALHDANENSLKVPRRPKWDESMTRFQLDRQEKEAFLEWRRDLARLQENNDLLLTPFERNLEVWRQLWRVVERSDLVVQIVDARNPLIFRSPDLANYVTEVDSRKKNLLLVNKADLLTPKQRRAWASHFKRNNINFTFFSAYEANQLLEQQEQPDYKPEITQSVPDLDDATRIIGIEELEELFMREAPEPLTIPPNGKEPILQIGLVGYPNVGKSSTINALIGSKKVSVSSTPGKTKHFQTIHLSDQVLLCDCPGLVFPNFAYTNGELVCCGVLPIDQLREYTGPSQLVAQRIPKYFLEAVYGIAIPTKSENDGGDGTPTSQELLTAYARARGYMTQGFGSADEPRAARYILKDYVNGKLPYVHPPPNSDNTPLTHEEKLEFNKELYTLDSLTENRREQILNAVNSKGLKNFNLAEDLSKLSFSSHIGGDDNKESRTANYGGKQAAIFNATDDLDREFFNMNSVKGNMSTPFHKLANGGSNKKHNKGNKKDKKKQQKKAVNGY